MRDTWGNLGDIAREAIRANAEILHDDEIASRIRRDDDGRVRFRLSPISRGFDPTMRHLDLALPPSAPEEIVLLDPDDFDYQVEITAEDEAKAAPIDARVAPLEAYFAAEVAGPDDVNDATGDLTVPPVVDHRGEQSPVKHQGQSRGTCVSHASLGLLETAVGVWASWRDELNGGVIPPLLDSKREPIGQGGHAMLLIGYDRPNRYFIVKNSWGSGWGHAGYGYFHYDFVQACSKYGFTVSSVEPPAS